MRSRRCLNYAGIGSGFIAQPLRVSVNQLFLATVMSAAAPDFAGLAALAALRRVVMRQGVAPAMTASGD